jgi:hypothetical protein
LIARVPEACASLHYLPSRAQTLDKQSQLLLHNGRRSGQRTIHAIDFNTQLCCYGRPPGTAGFGKLCFERQVDDCAERTFTDSFSAHGQHP